MKNKILLSGIAAVALLLSGCTDAEKKQFAAAAADANIVVTQGDADTTEVAEVETVADTVVEPTEPTPVVATNPYQPAGWYGKTAVTATAPDGRVFSHSTAGIFGELVQSSEAKDQHDIPGYGVATLQIVFPQTEWDEDNGDYFSNYKHYDANSNEKRIWTFQVKNQQTVDLSNASIQIDIKGIYDVAYKEVNGKVVFQESKASNQDLANELHLLDVDNRTMYTIEELKTANIGMDGAYIRTFRWVKGTVETADYTASPKTTAIASKPSGFTLAKSDNRGGKFGMPPQ